MKNFKLSVVVLLFSLSAIISCKKEVEQVKADKTNNSKPIAKNQTATFNIDGMTCAVGCAKTIESKLANTEGVSKATVDFDNKIATVEYNPTVLSPEKIVETVEAVSDGKTYKVSNVKSSADKAMLYQDKQEQEKNKKEKGKKEKKSDDEASTSGENAKGCAKKEKCCSNKKACKKSEVM